MKKIIVIGGGIASCMYAYKVKKEHPNYQVTIVEKSDKLLKRILVSGNGRCNFFNEALLRNNVYESYNYMSFFEYFNLASLSEELLEMLSDMGFAYYFDNEGRAYPFANTSESLWNTLVNSLKKVDVNILLNSEVRNIFPDKKTIKVNDKEQEYDTLFIGVGGAAYDRGLNTFKNIFESMNINYIDQSPALCPVTIQQKIPRFLSGTRLKGNLTLYKDDTPFYDEQGELLFKKDGISGICVFNSSLFINDDSKYTIKFNPFIHDKCMTSLDGKKPLEYLHGFFPSRLIEYFATLGYKKMDDEDVLNSLQFTVKGKYPLKNSQISLGGINPNEIETNLSLSKYPNIFVGGEIVDLHGICGGYNIGSALLMGFKAADSVD